MTARSGSTMLCSALKCLPALGQPDEYLNDRGLFQHFHQTFGGGSFEEFLRSTHDALGRTSHTLGIKTAYLDFRFLADSPAGPSLGTAANFIYLTRRDVFAQAISLWAARTTGVWHLRDGNQVTVDEELYNFDTLLPELKRVLRERTQWESYFSLCGITPLRLVYEDICGAKLRPAIAEVARHIGFELSEELLENVTAETTKISTEAHESMARRFREDCITQGVWNQLSPRAVGH